jgi:TPR repeat protein
MEKEQRRKLAAVVSELTQRWYQETLDEAKGGNAEMMMLVAQMLHEGYGCKRDPDAAKEWVAASKSNANFKG